jgi:hypothetical protein
MQKDIDLSNPLIPKRERRPILALGLHFPLCIESAAGKAAGIVRGL